MVQELSLVDMESSFLEVPKGNICKAIGDGKAALVTLCLSHLPFHPSSFLGYGAAILSQQYDLDVIDLNAEVHFKNAGKLDPILEFIDFSLVASDALSLNPFYQEIESYIDEDYDTVPWQKYSLVYVTSPSWFPCVPTEAVLRLSRAIKRVSPGTRIVFFSNSLGSWTNEGELTQNGIQIAHLNGLCEIDATQKPLMYDSLPTPVYHNRDIYIFDLLPFMLKHGCAWARCRFCSLCRGWNSGYLERSGKAVIAELESLIDQYDPSFLVCRDNSIKGRNLVEFCGDFERFNKPWCGMSRAELSGKEIEALRKSGCAMIFFGMESGSDRTLASLNKGITSKQMSDFISALHSSGIMAAPSLMIGTPDENIDDFNKTIQFLMDHRRCFDVVNVYPFMATPASEFGSREKQIDRNTPAKLLKLIQECSDMGLKVCIGEQCMEYFSFRWLERQTGKWRKRTLVKPDSNG